MSKKLPIIGEKETFYGSIIALGVEEYDFSSAIIPNRLLATFEYNGNRETWVVPNLEVFRLISERLFNMAYQRATFGDYGYEKLRIGKKDGRWTVDQS